MYFSDTYLQFVQLLERLRKLDWTNQFPKLKPPEFTALRLVQDYQEEHPDIPGIYVSELAERMHLPLPATSKLLKQLEHQGFIRRTVDLCRRRNTFVSITPLGESMVEEGMQRCAALGNHLFQQMGQEDATRLLESVARMVDLLEDELAKNPGSSTDSTK